MWDTQAAWPSLDRLNTPSRSPASESVPAVRNGEAVVLLVRVGADGLNTPSRSPASESVPAKRRTMTCMLGMA